MTDERREPEILDEESIPLPERPESAGPTAKASRRRAGIMFNQTFGVKNTARHLDSLMGEIAAGWRRVDEYVQKDNGKARSEHSQADLDFIKETAMAAAQSVSDKQGELYDRAEQMEVESQALYDYADLQEWTERAGGSEEAGAYLYRLAKQKRNADQCLQIWSKYKFFVEHEFSGGGFDPPQRVRTAEPGLEPNLHVVKQAFEIQEEQGYGPMREFFNEHGEELAHPSLHALSEENAEGERGKPEGGVMGLISSLADLGKPKREPAKNPFGGDPTVSRGGKEHDGKPMVDGYDYVNKNGTHVHVDSYKNPRYKGPRR